MVVNACRVGCCDGNVVINHLIYADDLIILAPYVTGLSKLFSICGLFCESLDIIFNQKFHLKNAVEGLQENVCD